MNFNWVRKIKNLLFVKIILIFIGAYVFTLFITYNGFNFAIRHSKIIGMQTNNINYAEYLLNEIGTPPDTLIAKQLAEEKEIGISIESPSFNFKSYKNMLSGKELDLPVFDDDENVRVGFVRGLYVSIQKGEYKYIFHMERVKQGHANVFQFFWIATIVLILLLLLAIYFLISKLLSPIKQLHVAVNEVSKGNLDYEVTTTRADELGELTRSFGNMTEELKSMLHSKQQLLLDVSHELRSPLTRIKIALEFLDDQSIRENIGDDIKEVETMITELLETERLKSQYGGIKVEDIDLIEILEESSIEFVNIKPGIKLLNIPKSVYMQGDDKRLKLLFNNVFTNAIKYSPEDGKPIEVAVNDNPNDVVIIIQDFGIGIPEKDLPYIFEPFYRVDKSRSKDTGGYGLGMSISKKIVEAHGGSINISSKLNEGTKITITIPIIKPK